MKRRPSLGEIIHLELPTISSITTAEHKRPVLLHSSPSPLVRQTGQLLRRYLVDIRVRHRHHIQSLTAERPPPLLTRTPIPTITDEPKRGHSKSPPTLLRQSPGKTRQHRLLRPQILLNRHTLGERGLRLRQTQRLLRSLRPRNQPTPRHQQHPAHKNTSAFGEHTAGHRRLPLTGAPRRGRKHSTWSRWGACGNTAAGAGEERAKARRPEVGAAASNSPPRPRIRRALTDPRPARRRTHRIDPTGRTGRCPCSGAGSAA